MIPAPPDRALLGRALFAVATSPTSPWWVEYRSVVEARKEQQRAQPPLRSQLPELVSLCRGAPAGPLPWHDDRVAHARLIAGLVSFADDYDGDPPSEILPARHAAALFAALHGASDLDVVAQLRLAREVVPGPPLGAVLALHLATRVLARNRDTRLGHGLDLPLAERLDRGRAIAPFDPDDSRGGDPLGDAYHYWANVAAGVHAAADGERPERAVVRALFEAGPVLMSNVRGRLFGRRLFYGDHARIDRLGLRHGIALAKRSSAT